MLKEYNSKLDAMIQKCIEDNNINPKECVLIEPTTFSGKYYILPKKFNKIKNGEKVDLSKAWYVGEIKMNGD